MSNNSINVDLDNISPEKAVELLKLLYGEEKPQQQQRQVYNQQPQQRREDYSQPLQQRFNPQIQQMDDEDIQLLREIERERKNLRPFNRNDPRNKETYRQLQMIHEIGVENFWKRVKKIVDSRKEIDKSTIDDRLDLRGYNRYQ